MERNYNVFEKNKTSLWILFILSIVFLAIGAWTSAYESMLVAASTLILTLIALQKKDSLYIPPLFIVLLTAVMILVQISNRLGSGFEVLDIASDVLIGMFTCILGLMMLLAILRSSPEFDMEHPFFISFSAFCIGTAVSLFLVMVNFWIEELSGGSEDALRTFILSMTFSMLGSLVTAAAFYFNRHNGLFEHTLNRFIKDNADVLGVQDRAKKEILKEIEGGESSKLEFKSTLRTNLKTGEVKPEGLKTTGLERLAFSGMHVVSPEIFRVMKDYPDRFPIVDFYLGQCQKHVIKAYVPDDYRMMDIGKIDSLQEAEHFAKSL
jgi:hypothetical protein